MQDPLLNKGFTPLGQLGVLLGFLGGGLILASLLSMGLWKAMTGLPVLQMQESLTNPSFAYVFRVMQVVNTLFSFAIPVTAYAFYCFRNGWQVLGMTEKPWRIPALLAVLAILCCSPIADNLHRFNQWIPIPDRLRLKFDELEQLYEAQVSAIAAVSSMGELLMSLVLMAALPALFEEMAFRAGLQGLLVRWWKHPAAAIFCTALLFSAIHASWYGFLPRLLLGVVLGIIYQVSQNLWYSVAAHFANNAAAMIYMYYQVNIKHLPVNGGLDSALPWWLALAAIPAVVMLLRALQKQCVERNIRQIHDFPPGSRDDLSNFA